MTYIDTESLTADFKNILNEKITPLLHHVITKEKLTPTSTSKVSAGQVDTKLLQRIQVYQSHCKIKN